MSIVSTVLFVCENVARKRRIPYAATIFLCILSEEWRRIEDPFICTSRHDRFTFTFLTLGISTLDSGHRECHPVTYIDMRKGLSILSGVMYIRDVRAGSNIILG